MTLATRRIVVKAERKKWIQSELFALVVTLALVTAARSSLADHYWVPTGSMEYSLLPGDRVVVDKTAYGVRIPLTKVDLVGAVSPRRGDVVVFDSPRDGKRLIKRVVAVGGDVVNLRGGRLSVNGLELAAGTRESYERTQAMLNLADGGGPDIPSTVVPEGMLLVLGDHRGDSVDGRFFGFIDERELYGRAVAVFYRSGEGFGWREL
jgi:signal peptidase I